MINKLFEQELQVINVGLASFADSIQQTGGKSLQLDWRPPASGNREIGMSLAMLVNDAEVEAANRIAHERFLSANRYWWESSRHGMPFLIWTSGCCYTQVRLLSGAA